MANENKDSAHRAFVNILSESGSEKISELMHIYLRGRCFQCAMDSARHCLCDQPHV